MLNGLVAADVRPQALFEEDSGKRARLLGALDEINGGFGRSTAIRLAGFQARVEAAV